MSSTPPGTTAPARRPAARYGPWALLAVLVVAAAIVFALIYITNPQNDHFNGLLSIGTLALIFALVCYLAEAISVQPIVQRGLAWGFMAMGFATLILTEAVAPDPATNPLDRIWSLLLILILLAIVIAGIAWRGRAKSFEDRQWAGRPAPSAFQYSTAQAPRASAPPAPPASVTPPPASPPSGGR
jgi:peptidoglycan/LPS O-acetylase OafA/YrhL